MFRSPNEMKPIEINYLSFLVGLMGDAFFDDHKNFKHPLYIDFWALRKRLVRHLDNSSDGHLIADALDQTNALMNAYLFSVASSGSYLKKLSFGNFSNLGEDVVRDIEGILGAEKTAERGKRTRGKRTESIMTELSVWSWLRDNCEDYEWLKEDSAPDFVNRKGKVCVECKGFVDAQSLENFLNKNLSKANRQLRLYSERNGEKYVGIVALDLTRYFAKIEGKGESGTIRVYSDSQLFAVDAEIKRAMQNRVNIDWVIYYWNELFPYNCATTVSIDRISRWVANKENDVPPLKRYGVTAAMNIHFSATNMASSRNSPCFCGSDLRYKHCHGSE